MVDCAVERIPDFSTTIGDPLVLFTQRHGGHGGEIPPCFRALVGNDSLGGILVICPRFQYIVWPEYRQADHPRSGTRSSRMASRNERRGGVVVAGDQRLVWFVLVDRSTGME